jgi:hypothetical protein
MDGAQGVRIARRCIYLAILDFMITLSTLPSCIPSACSFMSSVSINDVLGEPTRELSLSPLTSTCLNHSPARQPFPSPLHPFQPFPSHNFSTTLPSNEGPLPLPLHLPYPNDLDPLLDGLGPIRLLFPHKGLRPRGAQLLVEYCREQDGGRTEAERSGGPELGERL